MGLKTLSLLAGIGLATIANYFGFFNWIGGLLGRF